MTTERRLDVICLGRLALELHAQQRGARLEDVASFARHLGGSPASVAFGCARLGLRAAMLSRVGDDPAGRFLTETLAAEGCDVSHVSVDRERPTALALLGTRGHETVAHVPDRGDCADLAIDDHDVDEAFLAQSRALVVTGTQLSTEAMERVSALALERARRSGVRTVLDLAGCPVRGGRSRAGAGEGRRIASGRATALLPSILDRFDRVVGTPEEFRIAGGSEDLLQALRAIRGVTPATLVVRLGAGGCAVIDGDVPARIEDALAIPGFQVEGMNERGAGDAFMAGLLKGWLTGMDWRETGRLASACGALVVARPAGAASMPTPEELAHFLSGMSGALPARPDRDPHLARLHRVTPRRKPWDDLCLVDFDQRTLYVDERMEATVGGDPARFAGGSGGGGRRGGELAYEAVAPESRFRALNQLLVRAVAEAEQALSLQGHVGALLDDTHGEDALAAATGRGWWLARPVEIPGSSPVEFEGGRSIGSRLTSWPRAQVVACRVRFHPDEPVEDRLEQETQLAALYQAVLVSGHELLLEVVPPASLPCDGDTVVRALKRLYNIGIFPDGWRLEAMPEETWQKIDDLIAARDPFCRGVLVTAHEAAHEAAHDAALSAAAASRSCRGIFAGPTAVRAPGTAWLAGTLDDEALVAAVRAAFEVQARAWRRARRARKETT